MRARVISELVATERDFVSVLIHLEEGYLEEARKRPDLLLEEEVDRIFCNLSQILDFQKSFLADLEASIDQTNTSRSKVASVFLKHVSIYVYIYSSFKIICHIELEYFVTTFYIYIYKELNYNICMFPAPIS